MVSDESEKDIKNEMNGYDEQIGQVTFQKQTANCLGDFASLTHLQTGSWCDSGYHHS